VVEVAVVVVVVVVVESAVVRVDSDSVSVSAACFSASVPALSPLSIDALSMELRLATSTELRGDALALSTPAAAGAFLPAMALASLACSRSFARFVDDAREVAVIIMSLVSPRLVSPIL
jgi:hypothetical protein